MLYDRTYQPLIAPLIKRATRCTEDDRDRIAALVGKVIEEYTRRYPPYDTTERSVSAAYQYIISEHYTPGSLPNRLSLLSLSLFFSVFLFARAVVLIEIV